MIVEFWRKYGDIFMLSAGRSRKALFVCQFDWMKELYLQKADIFSGRPETSWLINYLFKGKGNLTLYSKFIRFNFFKFQARTAGP